MWYEANGFQLQGTSAPQAFQRYVLNINLKQGRNLAVSNKRSGEATAQTLAAELYLCSVKQQRNTHRTERNVRKECCQTSVAANKPLKIIN